MSDKPSTVVLAGLESVGKSALFRGLSRQATGDEANFRGSTVVCRRCYLEDCDCDLVDSPGLRTAADSAATSLALEQISAADTVLLVARGTHAQSEVESLLRELSLEGRRAALALTFADKAPAELEKLADHYRTTLDIPVEVVNARELTAEARSRVLAAVRSPRILNLPPATAARKVPVKFTRVQPAETWFEHSVGGPWLALATLAALFAVPVWAAFQFSDWLQPWVDRAVIEPVVRSLSGWPELAQTLLTGSYGVLTLGWYSFLWAFPVVALLGLSVALTEETGVKDRITTALDPWMRRIGLAGRDLIPVLSGFGCNVVAVFQSRACSSCSRRGCVSMISFGSGCSYQIGATLAVFGAGGFGWLFIPYLMLLVGVGAVHTRIWLGKALSTPSGPLHERSFLQRPSWRAVGWRLRSTLRQFLLQAMPIFLGICLVCALLARYGVMDLLARAAAPVMAWFSLPAEVAPGILFSILRKDGLLVLNVGEGAMVAALTASQALVLVWLASTLTACLVTLWTVGRELGPGFAWKVAGRQALTSLISGWLLAIMLSLV